MIRNTSLPGRVRVQAQLQLAQMHPYTRPTQIKNRCVDSGTARSVFRDFRINRVSIHALGFLKYLLTWSSSSSNSVCRLSLANCPV
jgi:ribosomal protein S14